ncbi:MAG: signal transduction histidine kinase [Planctomycetota bacterium]|jgi:signal transduction histidine kinase
MHPTSGPLVKLTIEDMRPRVTDALYLFQRQKGFACYLPLVVEVELTGILNGVFRFQNGMEDCLIRDSDSLHSFKLLSNSQIADETPLDQVVLNLAINAKDALGTAGILRVRVKVDYGDVSDGGYILLEVSDTGHGLPDEFKGHAFEPFFTTKEVGQEAGLGLATVHGILKSLRAKIEVHSELGRGAHFLIRFPIRSSDLKMTV